MIIIAASKQVQAGMTERKNECVIPLTAASACERYIKA